MNILIDKSVINNYGNITAEKNTFARMLMSASIRGCCVRIDPRCGFDDLPNDIVMTTMLQSLMDSSLKMSSEKRECDCTIAVGGEKELKKKVFSLEESCKYINSPAIIMVENKVNDGCFIRAIERIFDADMNFDELETSSMVMIDNAGGSGDRQQMEDEVRRLNNATKFLRCVIVVDSDKRFPSDDRKKHLHDENRQYYQGIGVGYHVLEKRAMENYMPDEVFQERRIELGKLWVDAYLSLLPEQKDYLDISQGFMKDLPAGGMPRKEDLPEGMRNHYTNVLATNFQRLSHPPQIQGGNMKNNFPKLYNESPMVRYDTMMNRTKHQSDPDELLHVAHMIRQIL